MKVCIVTSGIKGPTLAGGIGTAFFNLANLLAKNNFEVSVLYAAHPFYGAKEKKPEYWKKHFKNLSINFIPLDDKTDMYGHDMMKRSYKIYSFLNGKNYDKVIFHDYGGIAYYSVQSKKIGLNFSKTDLIINCHGNTKLSDFFNRRPPKDHNALATYYLERKSLELADYIISPSAFYLGWFKENGSNFNKSKSDVIQNILFPKENLIIPDEPELRAFDKQIHFAFFGRIETLKGVFVLLDAFEMLISLHPEYNTEQKLKLTLMGNYTKIGDTSIEEYVLPRIKKFNFEAKVIQDKDTDQALQYIKDTNAIVINPTLGENSPYTVLEALFYKIPFIASSIPGIKELVKEEDQERILFPIGKPDSLKDKILKILKEKHFQLARINTTQEETKRKWVKFLSKPVISKQEFHVGNTPKVSICVPSIGTRSIIKDTLLSLANQSYRNIEILIVLDGVNREQFENDHSSTINAIDKLGVDLKIESIPKSFKPSVCNYGAQIANGKYICFFDDDDIAKPHMIETYVKVLEGNSKIDLVTDFCHCFVVDENKGKKYDFSSEKITLKHLSLGIGNSLSSNLLINYFGKANFCLKRDKYLKVGGMTHTDDLTPYVDWDFFVKASTHEFNIQIIPEALYYYRLNSVDSIYYTTHDNTKLENASKRYLAHQKIINSVINSPSFPEGFKDYLIYSQSKLALPKISDDQSKKIISPPLIKMNKEQTEYMTKLNSKLVYYEQALNNLNKEKAWYSSTYDHMPKWYIKLSGIFRRFSSNNK